MHLLQTHLLGMILLGCAALLGCGQNEKAQGPNPQAMLVPVTVHETKAQDLIQDQSFVGETQSYCIVQIRGRVEGILLKRHFQEGQTVAVGDPLFTIDPRPFEAKFQQVKAALVEREAAHVNADKNHRRLQALVKEKAVSQKEADDAQANALIAKANVLSAKANVTDATLQLEYTQILSPISGVTSAFLKNEGDLVIPGPGENSLLTQVTQLDPIYVNFYVTDRELQASGDLFRRRSPHEPALKASLVLSDGSPYGEEGIITFTDPIMRQETGTFLMRATFPNPKHLLKPGQFVTLKLHIPPVEGAIVVPQRCVLQKGGQYLVFVVKADSSVAPRPIQGKPLKDNLFWVTAGLQSAENVVLDGLIKVKPGARVNIIPAQPSSKLGLEGKKEAIN